MKLNATAYTIATLAGLAALLWALGTFEAAPGGLAEEARGYRTALEDAQSLIP